MGLILDTNDHEMDKKLARHLVSLFWGKKKSLNVIDSEILRDYMAYAKALCNPIITDEASKIIMQGYLDLRSLGQSNKTISATPRQLESLIRLSEALAKIKLKPYVECEDALESLRLYKSAMQEIALDPKTGIIDIDLIMTGISSSQRIYTNELACNVELILLQAPERSLNIGELRI